MNKYLFAIGLLLAGFVPVTALAATTTPAPICVMATYTFNTATQQKLGVTAAVLWVSANANSVQDDTGSVTTTSGFKLIKPSVTTTYTYHFKNTAGADTICATTYTVASATQTPATPSTPSTLVVTGPTTLDISMVPLLSGGTAVPGSSVPIEYIELVNKGNATTTIDGFTLAQAGTASADAAVIGFTVSDDKGGSRATIGGTEGTKEFTNGGAFVPLAATLAPGQLRIFTIKATISKTSIQHGKTLLINVASVSTKATVTGRLPLIGVVWTL